MINKSMFSSDKMNWRTPNKIFDELNDEFHFEIDACADERNTKCKKFWSKEDSALKHDWSKGPIFCNPPYGNQLKMFVKKAHDEHFKHGTTIVLLIPARTDTSYFHDYILGKSEIRFIRGRLHFLNDDGVRGDAAPFPSMIVIYHNRTKTHEVTKDETDRCGFDRV